MDCTLSAGTYMGTHTPQVTDFSMLAPKETRELLYRMLRAGFLALQVGLKDGGGGRGAGLGLLPRLPGRM